MRIKRFICILMSVVFVLSALVFSSSAQENVGMFEIELLSDKTSYAAADTAEITVRAKNTSGKKLSGVALSVDSDKYLLAKGSENIKEVGALSAGKSVELSLKTVINRNTRGLSFWDKIVLFFKQLFNRPHEFKDYAPSGKTKESTDLLISHGGATVTVTAAIWYTGFSEKELEDMARVDERLNGSQDISDDLRALEDEKLISDYSESTDMAWFTYSTGVFGGVAKTDLGDNDIDGSQQWSGKTVSAETQEMYSKYAVGKALILYSFNYPNDMEYQSYRRPFYDGEDSTTCVNEWGRRQVSTDIDTSVTVSDLKNIGAEYDIVCFSGHGSFCNGSPVMCLTEKVTAENRQLYAEDLKNGSIATVLCQGSLYYWVFPSLFSEAYSSDGLDGKFIFIQCCEGFGTGGVENRSFADAMISSGADAVAGFCNSVNTEYGRQFMKACINDYLSGETAAQAYEKAREEITGNEPGDKAAMPVLAGNGEKLFGDEKASVTVTLIDDRDRKVKDCTMLFNEGDRINRAILQDFLYDIKGINARIDDNRSFIAEKKMKIELNALLIGEKNNEE